MAGFVTVAHVFQRAQNVRAVLLLTSTAIGRTKGKVFTSLLALSARGCTYMSYLQPSLHKILPQQLFLLLLFCFPFLCHIPPQGSSYPS